MSIRRGLLFSFGRTGGIFFVEFASNVILARLLVPQEIGVFAVAMTVTTVFHALRDFGVGRYLIQESNVTEEKVRTVFATTIIIGWSIAAVVFFVRDGIAEFYGSATVGNILAILCINFVLLPFGQPAMALMRREKRYGIISIISLSATAIGAVVSISFASVGSGPYALAYGALANTISAIILALMSRPDHLLLRPSLVEWKAVWRFGIFASGGSIIVQIGTAAPELVIGRVLGFAEVGLFSRASGLSRMFERFFVSAIGWIIGPELAERRRKGEGFGSLVLRQTDYIVIIGWPVLIFMALKAHSIIWILFGPNWISAAPILQALCVSRGIALLVSAAPAIYEGTGAVALQFRNEIVIQLSSLALLLIGAQYGLLTIAWLRSPLFIIVVAVHLSIFRAYTDINLRRLLHALRSAISVAAVFCLVLTGLMIVEPTYDGLLADIFILICEAFIMSLVFVFLLAINRHPLLQDFLVLFRRNPAVSAEG